MMRRAPAVVAAAVVVVVAIMAGLVLAGRPELDRARTRTDVAWRAVQRPLRTRYQALSKLVSTARDALGEDRTPLLDARAALRRWDQVESRRIPKVADEVFAANGVEGAATRVKTLITATTRLHDNQTVRDAQAEFDKSDVSSGRHAYDLAVRTYERARRGVVRRLATALLGYGSRPLLEPDLGSA